MSRRLRITLILLGLIAACLSLVLITYGLIPVETLRDQATLAPTLFAPP